MRNKLFKLKKWLTIDEAAQRLSIELEEKVTKADVLQLAVDEQIRMSVYFPHSWEGKLCDITTDVEKGTKLKKITIFDENSNMYYCEYDKCNDNEFIKILPETSQFEAGVWELKLIGNSKIDLEWQLKQEKNLPIVDVFDLSGFYVKNKDGIVIERQTVMYPDEYLELQKEIKNDIKKELKKADFSDLKKEKIREKIDSQKLENTRFSYPCAGLGEIEGAFFVIQTEHLNEFLATLDDVSSVDRTLNIEISKEVSSKSETSYLNIIGALLETALKTGEFKTQNELLNHILKIYQGYSGISESNLKMKFAEANKSLKTNL